eukprot:7732658-Pyramimonas_sp.AAC.1
MHQCQAGLRCPYTRLPVKKPTHFVASCEALVYALRRLRCEGRRACAEHRHIDGSISKRMQVWPWKLAGHIASGVACVVRRYWRQHPERRSMARYYPEVATGARDRDE